MYFCGTVTFLPHLSTSKSLAVQGSKKLFYGYSSHHTGHRSNFFHFGSDKNEVAQELPAKILMHLPFCRFQTDLTGKCT